MNTTETEKLETIIAQNLIDWLCDDTTECWDPFIDFDHEIEIGDVVYEFKGKYANTRYDGSKINIEEVTAYNWLTGDEVEVNLNLKEIEQMYNVDL